MKVEAIPHQLASFWLSQSPIRTPSHIKALNSGLVRQVNGQCFKKYRIQMVIIQPGDHTVYMYIYYPL